MSRTSGDGYSIASHAIDRVPATDPDAAHAAALYVCGAATDLDDAAMLLDALGLRGALRKGRA